METIAADIHLRHECVDELLKAGAAVTVENMDGHNALTVAAGVGDIDILRTLIKDPHVDVNHRTKVSNFMLVDFTFFSLICLYFVFFVFIYQFELLKISILMQYSSFFQHQLIQYLYMTLTNKTLSNNIQNI